MTWARKPQPGDAERRDQRRANAAARSRARRDRSNGAPRCPTCGRKDPIGVSLDGRTCAVCRHPATSP